jgi:hypothetical protein
MHTAKQTRKEDFEIEVAGEPQDLGGLLPDGSPLDRFGIVITATFGVLGASLLTQCAVTRHFDIRPERRTAGPIYPEIYAFDVGGPWGDDSWFDFYPPRKEAQIPAGDPVALLEEINNRGITRLALPDVPLGDPEALKTGISTWAEQAAAQDRLRSCWVYSADGRVENADVTISSAEPRVEGNPESTIWPAPHIDDIEEHLDHPDYLQGFSVAVDNSRFNDYARARIHEVSSTERQRLSDARAAARERDGGKRVETYRRIDTGTALAMIAAIGAA